MPRTCAVLAQDETDLLLFPPLRGAWGERGHALEVPLTGHNARRVVFGALNLRSGRRVFEVRHRQRQEDFHVFLDELRRRYGGRPVALVLDEDPAHTAAGSRELADDLDIELLWLPKRAPELNPVDHLWRHAKDVISANRQYPTVDAHADRFLWYVEGISARDALRFAGVFSADFWLRDVL